MNLQTGNDQLFFDIHYALDLLDHRTDDIHVVERIYSTREIDNTLFDLYLDIRHLVGQAALVQY